MRSRVTRHAIPFPGSQAQQAQAKSDLAVVAVEAMSDLGSESVVPFVIVSEVEPLPGEHVQVLGFRQILKIKGMLLA